LLENEKKRKKERKKKRMQGVLQSHIAMNYNFSSLKSSSVFLGNKLFFLDQRPPQQTIKQLISRPELCDWPFIHLKR